MKFLFVCQVNIKQICWTLIGIQFIKSQPLSLDMLVRNKNRKSYVESQIYRI